MFYHDHTDTLQAITDNHENGNNKDAVRLMQTIPRPLAFLKRQLDRYTYRTRPEVRRKHPRAHTVRRTASGWIVTYREPSTGPRDLKSGSSVPPAQP